MRHGAAAADSTRLAGHDARPQEFAVRIEAARRERLDYVYLGYWVADSRKMAYKTRFRPIEAFRPGGWRRLAESPAA